MCSTVDGSAEEPFSRRSGPEGRERAALASLTSPCPTRQGPSAANRQDLSSTAMPEILASQTEPATLPAPPFLQ